MYTMRFVPIMALGFLMGHCRPMEPAHERAAPSGLSAPAVAQHEGETLHNVLPVTEGLLSGSVPEGDAGFDALRTMGVRTIISVDGATPDVERARARGMRYVHLPTGYDGIRPSCREQLAAALVELPGPIYVHCHHGKHRGPAAAAVAAVALGKLSSDQGFEFLNRAGTSKSYPGLFSSVRETESFDRTRAAEIASELPEIARVSDLVAAMCEIDRATDHLEECKQANWQAPSDHPDLVPSAEAARIQTLFGQDLRSQDNAEWTEEFRILQQAAAERAQELTVALDRGDTQSADVALAGLQTTCRACHKSYRNLIPSE